MARIPLDQAISEIYEYLIKSRLLENGDHVITTGIDGSEISHRAEAVEGEGGSSSSSSVLAKTTAEKNAGTYECDFYANGKFESSTGSGYLNVLDDNIHDQLPVGSWVVASPGTVSETGGS